MENDAAQSQVSRAELLGRLERAFDGFDRFLDRLTAERWVEPGAIGAWSVADLLAHLIAHQQRATEEVRAAVRGKQLEIDHAGTDAFNERAVVAMRGQAVEAVRASWRASCLDVLELVRSLPDAAFDPAGDIVRFLDDTIDGALANNTYEHIAEHQPALEDWLRGLDA